MIQPQTSEPESSGAHIAGLSLQDAYLLFLQINFSNPDLPPIAGSGPLILTRDACETLSRVEKRLGLIERHPNLMVADDDCDDVARRLIGCNAIGIDEARDDVYMHRHFWKLFEDGEWKMTGRAANVAADERTIEPRFFRYFRMFRLRESIIEDGEFGGARFVDVRVYPANRPRQATHSITPIDENGREEIAPVPPASLRNRLIERGITPKNLPVMEILVERKIEHRAMVKKAILDVVREGYSERNLPWPGDETMRQRILACIETIKNEGLDSFADF